MITYVYGVRIYKMNPDQILIKQTVKKSGSPRYTIDTYSDSSQRQKHIDINDDKSIADAVRFSLEGKL